MIAPEQYQDFRAPSAGRIVERSGIRSFRPCGHRERWFCAVQGIEEPQAAKGAFSPGTYRDVNSDRWLLHEPAEVGAKERKVNMQAAMAVKMNLPVNSLTAFSGQDPVRR